MTCDVGIGNGEAGMTVGRGGVAVACGEQAVTISERRQTVMKKWLKCLKGIALDYTQSGHKLPKHAQFMAVGII